MFTITNRLRTIVAAGAVGAILASSAAASAAVAVHQPGTVTQGGVTTRTVMSIDPGNVGSAGQPGWDTATCQATAQAANNWQDTGDQRGASGDTAGQARAYLIANALDTEVREHCLVVD